MNRDLDGLYIRIYRDEKWITVCFSDMTEEEMKLALKGKSNKFLISTCVHLGLTLKKLGDFADIAGKGV